MKSEDAHLPLWSFKVSALHGSGADNEKPLNYLALKVVWDCLHNTFFPCSFFRKKHVIFKTFQKEIFFPFQGLGWLWNDCEWKKATQERPREKTGWLGRLWPRWSFFCPDSSTLGKPVNNCKYIEPSLLSFSLRRTITVRWLRTRVHI